MRIEEPGVSVGTIKSEPSVGFKGKTDIKLNDLKSIPADKKKGTEQKVQPDQQKLETAVDTANKLLEISGFHTKFRVDEESDRIQVSLIDNNTQEVIRQIPSEQMLELSARIKEMLNTFSKMVGVFVDELG